MSARVSEPRKVVNRQVADLLGRSEAFAGLPDAQRSQIFHDTAKVVDALSSSDPGNPIAGALKRGGGSRPAADKGGFKAEAMNQGVDAIARLIDEVDFPGFVSELIRGTFQAIVDASIQQMEAYGELVKSVAMSLNDFRDEQVTPNQGREHLMQKYPGFFKMGVEEGRPQLMANEDADFESVNIGQDLGVGELGDMDPETIEGKLVPAARTQIATSRQRLLATMVMMGINRIIVTDGEINAKVKFRFSATDQLNSHVQTYDYENLGTQTDVRNITETETESGERKYATDAAGRTRLESVNGAKRYTTGAYRYSQRPVIRLSSTGTTDTAGAIEGRGEMMGSVRVKFKSETFPLEKMLDSGQMMQLQSAGRAAPAPAAAAPVTTPAPAAAPATPAPPATSTP